MQSLASIIFLPNGNELGALRANFSGSTELEPRNQDDVQKTATSLLKLIYPHRTPEEVAPEELGFLSRSDRRNTPPHHRTQGVLSGPISISDEGSIGQYHTSFKGMM